VSHTFEIPARLSQWSESPPRFRLCLVTREAFAFQLLSAQSDVQSDLLVDAAIHEIASPGEEVKEAWYPRANHRTRQADRGDALRMLLTVAE
jgi:hypothetical protein